MREDTTTIRVREEEKDRINAMQGKQWEIVRDLLDTYEERDATAVTEAQAREIAEKVVTDRVVAEAQV